MNAWLVTDPTLTAALERARGYVMSPAEQHAQARSWVLGQMGLAHPELAHAELEALVDQALGPSPDAAKDLAGAMNLIVHRAHAASARAGWWLDPATGEPLPLTPERVAQKLMLIVSEVAEAMEGHRKGLADDKLPHRPMMEVELADAVIRIADLAGALAFDLGGALAEKMAFNASRPDHTLAARTAAGGKAY